MDKLRLLALPIGSISAIVLFAFTTPASAGEIDDLRRQVEQLMQRIERLEAKQQQIEANQASAPAAPSKMVQSGNDDIKVAISGQVNRALLYADDGEKSKFFQVDNDNASTRVRLVGTGNLSDDLSAGTQFEVEFRSNSTADIDIDNNNEVSPDNFTQRKLELYFDSKQLGRVWLGQGDTASNGVSEVDLSGTAVIATSDIPDLAGGLSFRNDATGRKLARINQAYSNFDGLSRRDRLRYDTPTFMGFQASTSVVQGDPWDVALRYAANLPAVGIKLAAAVAYADGAQRFNFNQVNGSISALHDSGVNLTLSAGTRDLDGRGGDDPVSYYGKLGYRYKGLELGETALSVDYGRTNDLAANGDEFETWGLFLVQHIDRIATELYVGYRNHELDRPGVSVDDIDVGVAGARIKF